MSTPPTDLSLIGQVLAVSLAILALSGIALYVAFRVRETLKEERGSGTRTVKLVLLIGILFLSGGVFYFFASGVHAQNTSGTQTNVTTVLITTVTATASSTSTELKTTNQLASSSNSSTTSQSTSITSVTTSAGSGTSTSSSGTSTTTTGTGTGNTTTTTTSPSPKVNMQLSFPTKVKTTSTFYLSFTITNSGSSTANSSALQLGGLLNTFTLVSSTSPVSGNVVEVGSLPPGSMVVTLDLKAPQQPQQFSGQVTLTFQNMAQPLSASIMIQVTAGQA